MSFTLVNMLLGPYFYLDAESFDAINVDTLPVLAWCGDHDPVTLAAPSIAVPQVSALLPHPGATKSEWSLYLSLSGYTNFSASVKELKLQDNTTIYLRYYQKEEATNSVNYGLFVTSSSQFPYADLFHDVGLAAERF